MSEPIEEPQEGEPAEGEESQFQSPENPQEPEPEEADAEEAPAEPEPEPESEPEAQPQGMSEKELERSLKALEKGATGWRTKVETIMGAEAGMLIPCPLCEVIIPGFIMHLDEERKATVRAFLGDREPDNYQADPHSRRCEACDGHGEVLTGSRVQAQLVASCVECTGRGWVGDRVSAGALPQHAPTPVAFDNGQTVPATRAEDSAEVAAIRAKGYIVLDPPPKPLAV